MLSSEDIRNFLLKEVLKDPTLTIEDDQDLLISGLLDSLSVVRLASYLETSCNITIPPEDVIVENFGTLNSIVAYLKRRS